MKNYKKLLIVFCAILLIIFLSYFVYQRQNDPLVKYKRNVIKGYEDIKDELDFKVSSDNYLLAGILLNVDLGYTLTKGHTDEGNFYYDILNDICTDEVCDNYNETAKLFCLMSKYKCVSDEKAYQQLKETNVSTYEGFFYKSLGMRIYGSFKDFSEIGDDFCPLNSTSLFYDIIDLPFNTKREFACYVISNPHIEFLER